MTADISTDLASWNITAASNQPDYSDAVGPNNLADNLRALQAGFRLVHSSSTIASATTTDLSTVTSYILTVTGTTTITGLGTLSAGLVKTLIFSGALTLTHNATTLILPTGASITTAADDVAKMLSLGSGNWRCIGYMRKSGAPLTSVATFGDGTLGAPGFAFTSDTDTGIYRSAANTMQVVAGGAASMIVNTTEVAVQTSVKFTQTEAGGYTQIGNGSGYSRIYCQHSGGGGIASMLELNATGAGGDAANLFEIKNSGGLCFRVRDNGNVFADGAYSGSGADFAEYFLPVRGANLQPGDTVALMGEMVKLASIHDEVIGVISDKPTVVGDMALKEEGGVLVGLVGKIWVKRGSPLNPAWRLLRAGVTHDRYLVR